MTACYSYQPSEPQCSLIVVSSAQLVRQTDSSSQRLTARPCNAVFVHTGFQHVLSNLLVWLALAMPLEYAYGTLRILAVWIISAFGSAFFSAAFEDSCTLVCHCTCLLFLMPAEDAVAVAACSMYNVGA